MSKILINENDDPMEPGAVDTYACLEDAELDLEPWYLDIPHCILGEDGTVMQLSLTGSRLTIAESKPKRMQVDLLRSLLIYHIRGIAGAQGWESMSLNESEIDSLSTNDLWGHCQSKTA